MAQNTSTDSQHFAPRVLRWEVRKADPALRLKVGDVLRFDPSQPKDARVVLERQLPLHCGVLDKMQLTSAIAPIGCTVAEARAGLVLSLLKDRDDAEAQGAAA